MTDTVVIGFAVVISVGSKPIVVEVQISPTWPHMLLAFRELKAMYTLGDVLFVSVSLPAAVYC